MDNVTTVGIDLAKSVFSLHAVDDAGKVLLRRTVSRAKFVEVVARLPPCLIAMEACGGAHEWARRFVQFGHDVRLIAARFVTPYRKSGKNDGNDAEAICEAARRPNMRFVAIKTLEQQSQLSLHRVRMGFVEERIATINRLRGLLTEFGHVIPLSPVQVRRQAPAMIEQLPPLAARSASGLLEHIRLLEERVSEYNREIEHHAKTDELAKRAQQRAGIGPITASAIVTTMGDPAAFKNGRQFAAWLGLVPRQFSTGGKPRLGRITKRGDTYLRRLLVMGARSVLLHAPQRKDPLSRWALALRERRGYHRACIAIAAKNARVVWAMLARPAAPVAE
ncbi:MAG: IS110 family transposase [Hyphomonas sp.]|jgi:transposase|nr:IS110 family transposase [Hyphomonas sp.]